MGEKGMAVEKICERCREAFQCGGSGCWRMQVPLTESQCDGMAMQFLDCLCPRCLPQVATDRLEATVHVRLDQA